MSTIHPAIWPSSSRINLLLHERPGTIHDALRVLERCEVDIQSVHAAFTGYRAGCLQVVGNAAEVHARWKILERALKRAAESPRVPDTAEDKRLLRANLRRMRVDMMQQIGMAQLASMSSIVAKIMVHDGEMRRRKVSGGKLGNGFLDDAARERGALPWYVDHTSWDDLNDFLTNATRLGVLTKPASGTTSGAASGETQSGTGDQGSAERLRADLRKLANTVRDIELTDHWKFDLATKESVNATECKRIVADAKLIGLQEDEGIEFWAVQFLRRMIVDHGTDVAYTRALLRLAYYALNRDLRVEPIALQCTLTDDQFLKIMPDPAHGGRSFHSIAIDELGSEDGSDAPFVQNGACMMSVSGPDLYARVRYLSKEDTLHRSCVMRVEYTITVHAAKGERPNATGVLRTIASAVAICQVNIERISTHLLSSSPNSECGAVDIMLFAPKGGSVETAALWRSDVEKKVDEALQKYAVDFLSKHASISFSRAETFGLNEEHLKRR